MYSLSFTKASMALSCCLASKSVFFESSVQVSVSAVSSGMFYAP